MTYQDDYEKGCALAHKLHQQIPLSDAELLWMIQSVHECKETAPKWLNHLTALSEELTLKEFGRKVFLRGLIEISNHCKNNCYYCGIRASNRSLTRYRLSTEEILACCQLGRQLGLSTFVLQGGEDPQQDDAWIESTLHAIRQKYSPKEAAITLSLGERSLEGYQRFYQAGADRYLLRHETHNPTHYAQLHPKAMKLEERLACLTQLKTIGFQTGTGMMIGSPHQTPEHLLEDLRYIEALQPQMVGIGPFIPQMNTPFADCQAGSPTLTVALIALIRLMAPKTLLPATTALATLSTQARLQAIKAGANVIMPNLSPQEARAQYRIYDNKASAGLEAAENIANLQKALATIDREIDLGRGDSPHMLLKS